jgi:hypothetical protein
MQKTNHPGIGDKTADLSAFRILFICFLLISLANFALFLWQIKYGDANSVLDATQLLKKSSDEGASGKKWIPLEVEKLVYGYQGYEVKWLDDPETVWGKISKAFGEFKPFFDLIALRIYGVIQFTPFILFVAIIGIAEGRRRYKFKTVYFENISSTQYHIIYKLGFFFVLFLSCFYLTIPFGSNLPVLDIAIPYGVSIFDTMIYYSSPIFWGSFISLFVFLALFYMSANFSTNI